MTPEEFRGLGFTIHDHFDPDDVRRTLARSWKELAAANPDLARALRKVARQVRHEAAEIPDVPAEHRELVGLWVLQKLQSALLSQGLDVRTVGSLCTAFGYGVTVQDYTRDGSEPTPD